ncbi:protein of unknown function [Legionella micdadei]|uniref:Uncharacterized protein n=1 Tax=Legionella micdadei TaxID=451 RepID=A0A098GJK9_LEGMI|nr:protein of unknown function [Legionella micdadei]
MIIFPIDMYGHPLNNLPVQIKLLKKTIVIQSHKFSWIEVYFMDSALHELQKPRQDTECAIALSHPLVY